LPEGRWVLLPSDGEEDAVTSAASKPLKYAGQAGRLWWLPAGGRGNGLDDDSLVREAAEHADAAWR
jgi:hypothetical protein